MDEYPLGSQNSLATAARWQSSPRLVSPNPGSSPGNGSTVEVLPRRLHSWSQSFCQLTLAGLCVCLFQIAFLFRNLEILVNSPPAIFAYPSRYAVRYLPAVFAEQCPVCDSYVSSSWVSLQFFVWKHCPTLPWWYTYGRLRLVHIQAATPGTYTGGYAWYTYGRSCLVHIRRLRVVHISTVNDMCSKRAEAADIWEVILDGGIV